MAAYVTSYISKIDKFSNVSWKDMLNELNAQIKTAVAMNDGMICEDLCKFDGQGRQMRRR